MRNSLSILFLIFVSVSISAQRYSEDPATITFESGETQKVLLKEFNFEETSDSIYYKRLGSSVEESTAFNTLRQIDFDESEDRYVLVNYQSEFGINGKKDLTKFAKILVSGHTKLLKVDLDLSEYNNHALGSERFLYLIERNSEQTQIDLFGAKRQDNVEFVTEKYKGRLKYLLQDCSNIDKLLLKLRFNDASMVRLFDSYYECKGTNKDGNMDSEDYFVSKTINEKSSKSTLVLGYSASISEEITNAQGVFGEYNLSFLNEKKNRRIGLSVSSTLSYLNYDWDFRQIEFTDVESIVFRGMFTGDLYVIKSEDVKLIFSCGLGVMFVAGEKVVPTQHNADFIIPFKLNLELSNKWMLSANYYSENRFLAPQHMFELGIGYVIGRKGKSD